MRKLVINFIAFQIGWFSCVLGAANGYPLLGPLVALAVLGIHLGFAAQPRRELLLLVFAAALGAVFDTLLVRSGWLVYPNGMIWAGTAPYWIVTMWLLFATTLNVSLRWLRGRLLAAVLLGGIGGPLSYLAGGRLGGLEFVDQQAALVALGVGWALVTPVMVEKYPADSMLQTRHWCPSMLDLTAYGWSFAAVLAAATAFWLISLARNDVSIVDSLWSLMFLLMAGLYQYQVDVSGPRQWLVLLLVAIWALRLSIFISLRNHGQPEDHRYQTIRRNNEPHFGIKSLFIVFGLQAALAGVVAMPLLVASSSASPLGWLDGLGLALWLTGMFFEVVGDSQLARFRADKNNRGQVLDTGLWRLTRHPNYFGEFTLWWGYFCFALAAGGWWTLLSPLLMSILLLKVSGVALLEKTINQRRPEYAAYIRRTNAFFPWRPAAGDSS